MIPIHAPTPVGTDPYRVSPPRLHDYLLHGKDHYPIDREFGEQLLQRIPEERSMALANRAWHRRAVGYMAGTGITQFLDLGAGLPTTHPTHEVVRAVQPDARVVYVDHDPLVIIHSHAFLATDPARRAVVQADLREPDGIVHHPDVRRLFDFDRPIGLILSAVLDFLSDADRPYAIVRALSKAWPRGSFIAISHITHEAAPDRALSLEKCYSGNSVPRKARSRAEIEAFFDGTELVGPRLTYVCDWRTTIGETGRALETYFPPDQTWVLGGVGRT